MKTFAIYSAAALILIVLFGALRAVLEAKPLFIKPLNDTTRLAYLVLAAAAFAILAVAFIDLQRVETLEIGGVRTTLRMIENKVDTLADQVEEMFKRKRIEMFNAKNWGRLHTVRKTTDGVILEVTLEQEPIVGSIEVYEGVLLMPESEYKVRERTLQFWANSDHPSPDIAITIKYFPKLHQSPIKPD
jgi:hypothetical protein